MKNEPYGMRDPVTFANVGNGIMSEKPPNMRCQCGWAGHDTDCKTKIFGDYSIAPGTDNDYSFVKCETWTNLACPKCGKEVSENKGYDQY